jgi:hypothetical protein
MTRSSREEVVIQVMEALDHMKKILPLAILLILASCAVDAEEPTRIPTGYQTIDSKLYYMKDGTTYGQKIVYFELDGKKCIYVPNGYGTTLDCD